TLYVSKLDGQVCIFSSEIFLPGVVAAAARIMSATWRDQMASSKRQQLISTAQDLFAREGYHATGIDRILAESGVAKMTRYKHFRSKDELILAVLQGSERDTLGRLAQLRAARPPREALLVTFDGLHAWIHQQDFCGCSFIHAAAEFHDR